MNTIESKLIEFVTDFSTYFNIKFVINNTCIRFVLGWLLFSVINAGLIVFIGLIRNDPSCAFAGIIVNIVAIIAVIPVTYYYRRNRIEYRILIHFATLLMLGSYLVVCFILLSIKTTQKASILREFGLQPPFFFIVIFTVVLCMATVSFKVVKINRIIYGEDGMKPRRIVGNWIYCVPGIAIGIGIAADEKYAECILLVTISIVIVFFASVTTNYILKLYFAKKYSLADALSRCWNTGNE